MADIYSDAWYASLQAMINQHDNLARRAPRGVWRVLLHVEGDSLSPYVSAQEVRYFLVRFADGKCISYEECMESPPSQELDFRFRGPASVFEGIAAGLVDPIEAGLKGTIKITGDMRILLRHADLVTDVLKIYMEEIDTTWPCGRPPYGGEHTPNARMAKS